MKYFKNSNSDLLVNPIAKNHNDLIEITVEEFKRLLKIKNTPTTEEEKDSFNADVFVQIKAIEETQIRPLRELFLDVNNIYAKDSLTKSNAEIEALRATLK